MTRSPDLEARVAAPEAAVAQFAEPEPEFMTRVHTEALHGTSILTVRLTHLPTGITVVAPDRAEAILKLRKALAGAARRQHDLQEAERRRERKTAEEASGAA